MIIDFLTDVKGEEKWHAFIYKIKLHLVLSPTSLDSRKPVIFGREVLLCKFLSTWHHHGLGLCWQFHHSQPLLSSQPTWPWNQSSISWGLFLDHRSTHIRVPLSSWHCLCTHHSLHSSVTESYNLREVGHILLIPLFPRDPSSFSTGKFRLWSQWACVFQKQ